MTIDTILAETTPRAMRLALMSGDDLIELQIDRPGRGHRAGDVFAGRVVRVVPGLNAAFVDVGEGVTGFLRAKEADVERSGGAISKLVTEGARVAVAIKTDARDEKGPVLTRRFDDTDGAIAAAAMRVEPPKLVSRAEPLLVHLAALYPEARVVADSPADVVPLRRLQRDGEIVLHQGAEPLLEAAGVEEQLETALAPEVTLRSGAVLRFEPGRTLTAVDVDSAAASEAAGDAVAINLEAAPVIAHQLRLRNLGGLVVVDFLNMQDKKAGGRLVTDLFVALKNDPAETALDGPSRFGLVEMARQRLGPTLAEAVGSPVQAASDALIRRLRRESRMQVGAAFEIRASPEVAEAFQGDDRGSAIARWVGRRLELVPDKKRRHNDFDVAPEL
ncbi:MAG: S1 RNA-binding domain-containing protein [Rhodospirillaceae bacterium]|jgi:ribonuclease G|nr:S1 RNA-binding domain-containing protein [Rhodospirillaceae bacterium]MBT6205271.1 S1 RNA-binding domain-containing protein [Rhodospirillaceae bacterium]